MTVESWEATAGQVVERLGVGLDALWVVLYAAQTAALLLSLAGPLVDDQPLSTVAPDLAEAVEELERARPELAAYGVGLDLVPIRGGGQEGVLAEAFGGEYEAYRDSTWSG